MEPVSPKSSAPSSNVASARERPVLIAVTQKGFEPATLDVIRGTPITLMVIRRTERTCATEIVVDELSIRKSLPTGIPVRIAFTPSETGQITFGCARGKAVRGVINVVTSTGEPGAPSMPQAQP